MLYFWQAQGPRTSKLIFPTVKYTNTQIQIHKYSFVEVPGIPNICYISKQLLIQGCQKWYSQLSKVIRSEIQKSTSDFCIVPPGLSSSSLNSNTTCFFYIDVKLFLLPCTTGSSPDSLFLLFPQPFDTIEKPGSNQIAKRSTILHR